MVVCDECCQFLLDLGCGREVNRVGGT